MDRAAAYEDFRRNMSLVLETSVVRTKKSGALAWDREPRKARSVAGVVFTPARGVIHPCFPLTGRWERSAKSDKQAPSPSLVSFHISSFETPPRNPRMHGFLQCYVRTRPHKYLLMLKLALCNDHADAPNPHCGFNSELPPF